VLARQAAAGSTGFIPVKEQQGWSAEKCSSQNPTSPTAAMAM